MEEVDNRSRRQVAEEAHNKEEVLVVDIDMTDMVVAVVVVVVDRLVVVDDVAPK